MVPGWAYKKYAYGEITYDELQDLEKLAESLSAEGVAGARQVVRDPSNNLQKVMKDVDPKDRDDVLRALRQMKKEAADCATGKASPKKRLKKMIKEAEASDEFLRQYYGSDDEVRRRAAFSANRALGKAVPYGLGGAVIGGASGGPHAAVAGGLAGALVGGVSELNDSEAYEKELYRRGLHKQADIMTAGGIMAGAALAPVAGHLAMRGINAMSRKSQAEIQQDLKRILQVHPDIGRANDPRVQMAYATLVRLNPEYAEDPLIAGPLLKQIVDGRMDPTNPSSASYIDPNMAKALTEARKSHVEGMRYAPGLGGDMKSSIMSGTQAAGGALFK